MPEIRITVKDKVAQTVGAPVIVCGNSDYTVKFNFDEEWEPYVIKTARLRFYQNGILRRYDKAFTGNTIRIPALHDIPEVEIGVYAGNVKASTGARIPCDMSITDGDPTHDAPSSDVYAQLMEYLANLQHGGTGIAELNFIGTDNSETGIAEEEE